MENSPNYINIVSDLNEKYVLDVNDNTCGKIVQDFGWIGFTYQTDGYVDMIFFNDICIFDSDNDERESAEEEPYDFTETVEEYVIRRYEQLIKLLSDKINKI